MDEKNTINNGRGKNPFTVPDHYFDNLTKQVMATIEPLESEISPKGRKVSFRQTVRPWLYMAAMFIGLIFIAKIILLPPQDNPDKSMNPQEEVTADNLGEDSLSTEGDDYLEFVENQYENQYYGQILADSYNALDE